MTERVSPPPPLSPEPESVAPLRMRAVAAGDVPGPDGAETAEPVAPARKLREGAIPLLERELAERGITPDILRAAYRGWGRIETARRLGWSLSWLDRLTRAWDIRIGQGERSPGVVRSEIEAHFQRAPLPLRPAPAAPQASAPAPTPAPRPQATPAPAQRPSWQSTPRHDAVQSSIDSLREERAAIAAELEQARAAVSALQIARDTLDRAIEVLRAGLPTPARQQGNG